MFHLEIEGGARVGLGDFGRVYHDDRVLSEVGDLVFAYVQSDGSWYINDAVLWVGECAQAVMVDTTSTKVRNDQLFLAYTSVLGSRYSALIKTHFHGDHANGNDFGDTVNVIAHVNCPKQMAASEQLPLMVSLMKLIWGKSQRAC